MERESSEGMGGWWKTAGLGSTTYKTTCCYTQNTERDKNYDNTYCLTSHLWEKTYMTNIMMKMGTRVGGLFVPHKWQKPDNMKHKPKEPIAQGGLVLNQCMTKDRKLRKTIDVTGTLCHVPLLKARGRITSDKLFLTLVSNTTNVTLVMLQKMVFCTTNVMPLS